MDEYLVSLQLKGKSELTHDETISNHSQQLSPAGAVVSWCCAATFSPFPLLSHSLHQGIPELCHSLSRPRAFHVPWDQKGTDRLTGMNQSWISPFDLSPFYHYPSDFASYFGKLHSPGKAQRGNILGWAKLVCFYSPVVVLMVRAWFVPKALTASLFLINTTCAECECSLQWVEGMAVWTQLLALHSGDKDKDHWKGSAGKGGGLAYCTSELKALRYKRREQFDESFEPR